MESILLVRVPGAQPLLDDVRRRYDLYDDGVPAHVTCLYPFRHPDLLPDDRLGPLLRSVPSFAFSLAAVGRFPNVAYLAPEPAQRFVDLTGVLAAAYPECPPYWGLYDEIVPHCTMAQTEDPDVLEAVAAEIAAHLPVQAEAKDVELWEQREGIWSYRDSFPLGG